MKKLQCKINDCSHDDLVKLAQKSGFIISEGAGHSKVKTISGVLITTIPRHNRIKRYTAKGIADNFNRFGANIEIC